MIPKSLMDKWNDNNCTMYHADVKPHKGTEEFPNIFDEMFSLLDGINLYDLYRYSEPDVTPSEPLMADSPDRIGKTIIGGEERTYKRGYTAAEYTPWLKHHPSFKSSQIVMGDPVSELLNSADVRTQLHIPEDVPAFEQCNGFVGENWHYQQEASLWIYKILRGTGIKMLHYSGDTDGAVPTLGTKKWIEKLNFPITKEWTQWFTDGQVSGYIEQYDGLDFVTVKGVGHMAPQWARKQVQQLLNKFISNEPLV